MTTRRKYAVLVFGILALIVASLSIADMFFQKPYDGIVSRPQGTHLLISSVAPSSPAQAAGLQTGDIILGIAHQIVQYPADAGNVLVHQKIGQTIPYLIKRGETIFTVPLTLGKYRLASVSYYYFAAIGLIFFLVGLLVFLFKSEEPSAILFFLMSIMFFLFLVCSLRPHSYYWVDWFVHTAGTFSLFLMPAFFLHFFLIFPRPVVFIEKNRIFLWVLYGLPAVFFLPNLLSFFLHGIHVLSSVGTWPSWALLALYFLAGLFVFVRSFLKSEDARVRRKLRIILWGLFFGLIPFLIFGVILGSFFGNTRYLLAGVIPMVLVPVSFAYAIIRFQLMDIDIWLNKGVVYSITTFVISLIYVLLIASLDSLTAATQLAHSPVLPFVLALIIVYFFNPLRDRIQNLVDRTFFKEHYDYKKTMGELSDAIISILRLEELLPFLTKRLREILGVPNVSIAVKNRAGIRFQILPEHGNDGNGILTDSSPVMAYLKRVQKPIVKSALGSSSDEKQLSAEMERLGYELLVPLFYEDQLMGSLNLGPRASGETFTGEDIQLLKTLANQTAIAVENALLHQRLTHQAELTRDLKIASEMQNHLLPKKYPSISGVEILSTTLPAQEVGGDFYDFIEIPGQKRQMAVSIGDVSAKSISGAIAMVAAKEIIHSEARDHSRPALVLKESSLRLYGLLEKSAFVTLFYGLLDMQTYRLHYACAGHPLPMVIRGEGEVFPLERTQKRFPLGPLPSHEYDEKSVRLQPGDILCLYTDGLVEAMNAQGQWFGEDNLQKALARARTSDLKILKKTILDEIFQFLGNSSQNDDITLVLIKIS